MRIRFRFDDTDMADLAFCTALLSQSVGGEQVRVKKDVTSQCGKNRVAMAGIRLALA
jgi:hypothetical protein